MTATAESGGFSLESLQLGPAEVAEVGRMLVLGIALALSRSGVTKEQLKKVKPAKFNSLLPGLMKSVLSSRNALVEEFRLLLRLGPEAYLKRRTRDIIKNFG